MKSEHRHELAENDLSKLLARWSTEFDKYANTVLSVLIIVALLAAVIIYWTRTSAATSALGWTDLTNAGSAEDYQSVAEVYAGTEVAEWATLRAGDGFLREGIRLSLTDRTASNERLSQAKDAYNALLQNTGAPPPIREQALIGYAVTLESLSDGDTNAAVEAYEKLIDEFPDSRFQQYAVDRIAELKTGGAQDFYAWFHRLNPKPADLPGPQDQSKLPGDLSSLLPELGGSGLPTPPPSTIPAGDSEDATGANPFADEQMKTDAAAESEDSEKKDADASQAPADKQPAEKPASEKSATGKPVDGTDKDDAGAEKPKPAADEPATSDSKSPAESPETSDAPASDSNPASESKPESGE